MLRNTTSEVVLKSLFKKYDKDGSNSINSAEFKNLVYDMGFCLNKEETETAVKYIDADDSGKVEFGEFKAWWIKNAKDNKLEYLLSEETLGLASTVAKCFLYFDADRSGSVDAKELTALLTHLQLKKTEAETKELMVKLDHNKDKTIQFNEFIPWYLAEYEKAKAEIAKKAAAAATS
eukprot:gb/GEZN01019536.1/.p1 GENE.gb/GEZN01019536.1/~~gb/GEZN01019536.1/.p1  ORF type:complete len:189 (-),score=40.63 gb/GEZN01019536.1/:151-681(-)